LLDPVGQSRVTRGPATSRPELPDFSGLQCFVPAVIVVLAVQLVGGVLALTHAHNSAHVLYRESSRPCSLTLDLRPERPPLRTTKPSTSPSAAFPAAAAIALFIVITLLSATLYNVTIQSPVHSIATIIDAYDAIGAPLQPFTRAFQTAPTTAHTRRTHPRHPLALVCYTCNHHMYYSNTCLFMLCVINTLALKCVPSTMVLCKWSEKHKWRAKYINVNYEDLQ
jgi:hypothetical protein